MGKEERERQGYPRLTAYCIAEGFRSKALAAFLKREHGVHPRVFDEAIYAVSSITIAGYFISPIHISGLSSPSSSWLRPERECTVFRSLEISRCQEHAL